MINQIFSTLVKPAKKIISSNKGQTAVVMIFIIAIALVMYSASLNWGRVAQYKALVTIGSNTAAANMASTLASYGENVLQTTLGGRREICKKTNFIVLVVTVIIAIIVTYLCWGTCGAAVFGAATAVVTGVLGVLSIVMAVAALVINVAVVEPGLTRLWNRMQSDMALPDQVIEGGLVAGLRAAMTDSKRLWDHFDYDVDGLWVDDTGDSNNRFHKDLVSRFGFYYTKRLLVYAPPVGYPEIEEFKMGLSEILYDNPSNKVGPPPTGCTPAELATGDIRCQNRDYFGIFDPGCNAVVTACSSSAIGGLPSPYCNSCCLPQFQEDGVTPLRPVECTPVQVAACGAGDYPLIPYQWQYDPFYENYTNGFYSFREQLGVDDENEGYHRDQTNPNPPPPQTLAPLIPVPTFREEDSTGYLTAARQSFLGIVGGTPDVRRGVLPFFWDMSKLLPAQPTIVVPPPAVPFIPKTDSVIMMTANPLNCTVTSCPNNFIVPPDQCAVTVGFDGGTNRPKTDGFYWKPGADEYCSNVYPYNDCISYVGNCATGYYGGAIPDCGCPASDDPRLWHDDNLDVMIYGLKQFIAVAQDFLKKDPEQLDKDFLTWFPTIAEWISPQCGVTPNSWCYDGPNDGVLLVWRDMVGSWVDLIDTWVYQTSFADDTNWCVPTAATANNDMTYVEKRVIPSLGSFTTVSTDTLTIANGGTIALNVGINLNYAIGQSVLLSFDANNYMIGSVALYNQATGSLTVNLNSSVGYGSYSNWTVDRIVKDRDGVDIPTIWGDLNDVVACMNFNTNNAAKLTTCQTACLANPTDYTGNANACLNLPRSVVNLRNSSVVATENTAYQTAQRLQDCLSSTCQDSLGATLPVCTGLPVAQPVDCTAFGAGNPFYDAVRAERDNQFNLSNYCEPVGGPTGFQINLVTAINAANAHDPILDARSAELTFLRDGALNARNVFLSFYRNLNIFLTPCNGQAALGVGCDNCANGGPAAKLICANQRAAVAKTGLSQMIIYGWQSKPVSGRGPTGTDPDKGYWHIIRAEAFVPQRCWDRCGTNRLPWVKTKTRSRGLNRIRCYTLTDTDGRVISRVTRWDEDHDSPGARLANGQLLWKFRYTNPGVAPDPLMGSINSLSIDCRHPASWDVGMAPDSVVALEGAFMINNNPVEDPTVNRDCFRTVQGLLAMGVQSTTCARYYYDDAIKHMSLKFTPCVQADVDYVTACVASGLCP